jgi:hypothetical protein
MRQRIEKLEGNRDNQGTPDVIVATCPIPETDLPRRPAPGSTLLASPHGRFGARPPMRARAAVAVARSERAGEPASGTSDPCDVPPVALDRAIRLNALKAIPAATVPTFQGKNIPMTLDEINKAILEQKRKRDRAEALAHSSTKLNSIMAYDKVIDELESLRINAQ